MASWRQSGPCRSSVTPANKTESALVACFGCLRHQQASRLESRQERGLQQFWPTFPPSNSDNPRSCCLHSTTPRQHHNNNNGSALLIPSGACCFGFPYRRRPSRLGGCTRFLILSPAGALKEGFCCLGRYPPFFAVDSSNLPAHKTTQPIFVELVPNHPPSWILMSNRFSTSKMSPKDILQWWYVRSVQQRSHQ